MRSWSRIQWAKIKQSYTFLKLEWSEQSVAAMSQWIGLNSQHKYGIHRYGLAIFDLDAETLDERFKGYRENFDVKREV